MIRDLGVPNATSDAMMGNVRRPIVLSDATAVIDAWAKLYRFEGRRSTSGCHVDNPMEPKRRRLHRI